RPPFQSDGGQVGIVSRAGFAHVTMIARGSSGGALSGLTPSAGYAAFHGILITAITTRRADLGEDREIEIGDGLQRLGHGGAAQAVRQCHEPIGILGLQRQQHVGRVIPTLDTAAPVDRPARPGHNGRWLRQTAGTIARLALGVAQRVLALWFLTSRHGPDLRYVTHCSGVQPVRRGMLQPPARRLRRLSPLSSIRCALWMIRSRIASASVGLPTISYQRSIGTWLVMISEPAL